MTTTTSPRSRNTALLALDKTMDHFVTVRGFMDDLDDLSGWTGTSVVKSYLDNLGRMVLPGQYEILVALADAYLEGARR